MRHWLRGWMWHQRHTIRRVLGMVALTAAFDGWLVAGISIAGGTDTEFGTGAAEAVKLWATEVWHEAPSEMMWGKFIGREKNSVIQEKTELEGKPGDELTFSDNTDLFDITMEQAYIFRARRPAEPAAAPASRSA